MGNLDITTIADAMGRSSADARMRCRSCIGGTRSARHAVALRRRVVSPKRRRRRGVLQKLLLARTREHSVQARFASPRGVPMDNAAFCRFIDRGNKSTHVVRIGLGRAPRALLHAAQTRDRAAIAKRSAHILASTFGGGFGVGHDLEKLWARRLVEPCWIVKMLNGRDSPASQRRGYGAAKQSRPRNILRDDRTLMWRI